jgi:hypothetical protein
VAKRSDYTIRWADDIRLPRKIRNSYELFDLCLASLNVPVSKREDWLLDILPYWKSIDRNLSSKVKSAMRQLCDYPIRGRLKVREEVVEEEVISEETHTEDGYPRMTSRIEYHGIACLLL